LTSGAGLRLAHNEHGTARQWSAVVIFKPGCWTVRLLAADGTNFRVNVDTGEVLKDGK